MLSRGAILRPAVRWPRSNAALQYACEDILNAKILQVYARIQLLHKGILRSKQLMQLRCSCQGMKDPVVYWQ